MLISPFAAPDCRAEEPNAKPREIFVPYGDLHVLLEQQPQRVMLTREEYDSLAAKAKKTPEKHAPRQTAFTAAQYDVQIRDQRAELTGRLTIDVLESGLYAVPLDIAGVGIRRAEADGKPAALGRPPAGPPVWFVEGLGRHVLRLEMVAPVPAAAARQTLSYRLPRPAATQLTLTAAGDVEVKSGAAVIRRTVETDGSRTHFDLLPQEGDTTLVLSLNSHLQGRKTALVARSVVVADKVTTAYEKIDAVALLEVLHRAIDRVRIAMPGEFEITEVTSPLMARWEVNKEEGRKILTITLREQTTDPITLHISALRTGIKLDAWQAPQVEVLDAVAQASILGVLVEERLKPESLAAEGLIAIDTEVLNRVLPADAMSSAQGTSPLRAVAAYYAPQSRYALGGKFIKPASELAVNASLLWRIGQRQQELLGGLTLLPLGEKRFAFDFCLPAEWTVAEVTAADGRPLRFERYTVGGGSRLPQARFRVTVAQGMPADQEFKANFRAALTPPGWLDNWKTRRQDFPACELPGTTRLEGAVAVSVRDDITARPEMLRQLTPLDAVEKARYGLENAAVDLAYRYEAPGYAAALVFERTPPRVTARSFSFLKPEAERLTAHYEVTFTIDQARTQTLALLLPAVTPTALLIRGLDNVEIKETSFKPAAEGSLRKWNVLLAAPRRGKVRLAVDFQQTLPEMIPNVSSPLAGRPASLITEEGLRDYPMPLIRADGVEYESGVVAVEGDAEYETEVKTDARPVDVGELAEADYEPGRRLMGAWGFAGNPPEVKVTMTRKPEYALSRVIVEQAGLFTRLSPNGESRTQADFRIRAKALYVELQLPQGAELWSALIDGEPTKPQREGKRLLLEIPTGMQADGTRSVPAAGSHDLQFVYRMPAASVGLAGTVAFEAPKLFYRARPESEAVEAPLVDLEWKLAVPGGYEVVRTNGNVTTADLERPTPAALEVAGILYWLTGGVGKFGLPALPVVKFARKSAQPAGSYYSHDDVKYGVAEAKTEAVPADTAEPAAPAACLPPTTAPATESMPFDDKTPPAMLLDLAKRRDTPQAPKASEKPATGGTEKEYPVNLSLQITQSQTVAKQEEMHAEGRKGQLLGVRSLKIDLDQSADGRVMTFCSLGAAPMLEVELARKERFDALGWAVALSAGLIGLALTCRSGWTKTWYVVGCLIVATLIPIFWECTATARVCNMLFYAASLLVPYYLLIALIRKAAASCRLVNWRCCRRSTAATAVLAAIIILGGLTPLGAQGPAGNDGRIAIQVVPPEPPVKIPDDAIVIPYDPDEFNALKDADKLLIPYAKYVELWNRAYPDRKLETPKLPAEYALAGADYRTTLEGDEYLLITGQIAIDIFGNEFVQIPLGLGGGVLARAELDGKPARLQLAAAETKDGTQSVPVTSLMLLTLSGKGRHQLELTVRMKLSREGGWRAASGTLPTAAAAALTLTVPLAETEVRLQNLPDRPSYDTNKPGETIVTALGAAGQFGIRWRPKVAEGQVDRGLTAQSDAALDVQEDGLRLNWQLALDFRGSPQEEFDVTVPKEYLVENVEGGNVRGWESVEKSSGRVIRVNLLKAAKEREQIVLRMRCSDASSAVSHPLAPGESPGANTPINVETAFTAPLVTLPEAALHRGRITLRRSPLLDVRTTRHPGMNRCDVPADLAYLVGKGDAGNPLGARTFEAYQFDRDPGEIGLSIAPIAPRLTADVQTVFSLSEYARKLESRIRCRVQDRPIFRLRVALPKDFRLDHLFVPYDYQYVLTDSKDHQLLTVFLAAGRVGDFDLIVNGALPRGTVAQNAASTWEQIGVPRVEVLDAERQEGEAAVLVDADYDYENAALKNCEQVLLDRVRGWLKPEQFALARAAFRYRRGGYAAAMKFRPRVPEVSCDTLSNVRVTDRAVEEVIVLDYTIRNAGIGRVSFLLPAAMARAKISAPPLRQKTIRPADDKPGSPLRVTLELQQKTLKQLRILVENDRLLTDKPQAAPIPVVEDAEVNRQYVTLESAGRDELVIEKPEGLARLQPEQAEWKTLLKIIPRPMTHAYLITGPAAATKLTYRSNVRKAVQVVSAWIGLVDTELVFDDNGTYRAQQTYHLRNATEQYLQIELPLGAELWTARVANEPVKPVKYAKERRNALIPLITTAEGDLAYRVVIRYGGKLDALDNLRQVDFPLARTVPINPARSRVWLYLPRDRHWMLFDGTMRRVENEDEMKAVFLQFKAEESEKVRQDALRGNEYTQQRAAISIQRQLSAPAMEYQYLENQGTNENLRQAMEKYNATTLASQKDIEQQAQATSGGKDVDTNSLIVRYYNAQTNDYSGSTFQTLGKNFDAGKLSPTVEGKNGVQLNAGWLEVNRPVVPDASPRQPILGKEPAGQRKAGGQAGKKAAGYPAHQPSAAQVAQGKNKQELELTDKKAVEPGGQEDERQKQERFRERFDRQQTAVQLPAFQSVTVTTGVPAVRGFQTLGRNYNRARFGEEAGSETAGPATQLPQGPAAGDAAAAPATGLGSLDFCFPTPAQIDRSQVFLFTAPQGKMKITARSLSDDFSRRTLRLGAALIAIGALILLLRSAPACRRQWLAHRWSSTAMIVLGVLSILSGVLPVVGLLLLLAGLALLIRRHAPTTSPATPAG